MHEEIAALYQNQTWTIVPRPPPDDQDLLPRRNTYLCLCKKPRLRGLGTSFFIRFDLVLILSMPKNLKWLVQDLLPQEKTRTTGSAASYQSVL
jgi:hypothetical protein